MFLIKTISSQMLISYCRHIHIIQTQTISYLLTYRILFHAYSFMTFRELNRITLTK